MFKRIKEWWGKTTGPRVSGLDLSEVSKPLAEQRITKLEADTRRHYAELAKVNPPPTFPWSLEDQKKTTKEFPAEHWKKADDPADLRKLYLGEFPVVVDPAPKDGKDVYVLPKSFVGVHRSRIYSETFPPFMTPERRKEHEDQKEVERLLQKQKRAEELAQLASASAQEAMERLEREKAQEAERARVAAVLAGNKNFGRFA